MNAGYLAVFVATVMASFIFGPTYNAAAATTAASTRAAVSKPSLAAMTADIKRRTKKWSTVPATVEGVWYHGAYAVIAYNTGESGGSALYVIKGGSTHFVCGGGGALTRAAAVEYCGLSRSLAAKIFPT